MNKRTAVDSVALCGEGCERGDSAETSAVNWLVAMMKEALAYREILRDGSHYDFPPEDLVRYQEVIQRWWLGGNISANVVLRFASVCKSLLECHFEPSPMIRSDDPSMKFYESRH